MDNLHFPLGVLRLENSKRVDAACSLLRKFEQDGWGQVFRALSKESNEPVKPTSTVAPLKAHPFIVDSVGIGGSTDLRTSNTDLSRSMRLFAYIQASTDALKSFCRAIYSRFHSAGFGMVIRVPSGTEGLQIRIANTSQLSRKRRQHPRLPPPQQQDLFQRFDVREIEEKYRGVPWIEGVPLQEIRITELGRPRKPDGTLLHHAFNDVTSFKLPGSYETSSKQEGIDA